MKISESTDNDYGGSCGSRYSISLGTAAAKTGDTLTHLANVSKRRGARSAVLCRLALFEF